MKNQFVTLADGSHVGYPAPGGEGIHAYEDDFGNQWEIQFHPERFRVYRRWFEQEPLEGEFQVLESNGIDPGLNEDEINEPVE